jgi:hypothetical protein
MDNFSLTFTVSAGRRVLDGRSWLNPFESVVQLDDLGLYVFFTLRKVMLEELDIVLGERRRRGCRGLRHSLLALLVL